MRRLWKTLAAKSEKRRCRPLPINYASLAANDERRGAEQETYRVTLLSEGERLTYAPSTASEFAAFVPGSDWTVTLNGLGAIVGVEAAP